VEEGRAEQRARPPSKGRERGTARRGEHAHARVEGARGPQRAQPRTAALHTHRDKRRDGLIAPDVELAHRVARAALQGDERRRGRAAVAHRCLVEMRRNAAAEAATPTLPFLAHVRRRATGRLQRRRTALSPAHASKRPTAAPLAQTRRHLCHGHRAPNSPHTAFGQSAAPALRGGEATGRGVDAGRAWRAGGRARTARGQEAAAATARRTARGKGQPVTALAGGDVQDQLLHLDAAHHILRLLLLGLRARGGEARVRGGASHQADARRGVVQKRGHRRRRRASFVQRGRWA
jgi:hypothetical protein